MNASEFRRKWQDSRLRERAASQEHFLDLCAVLDHPTPAAVDKEGDTFTFDRGATKQQGGEGWADVWKKGFFGWEYKGKHKNLDKAYGQLLQYREALENPRLLVVCDMDRIIIHTNFTAAPTQVYEITLETFTQPRNIEILRAVFHDPDKLKPGATSETITADAASRIGDIAQSMRARKLDPHEVAHFLDRIVFCLFAEDIELLPDGIFSRIIEKSHQDPLRFSKLVRELFDAMADGGDFGADTIRHFNGDLFVRGPVPELTDDEIERIYTASRVDWSAVDPSIFGTLFERGMDPDKRSQIGAHYTGRADIETLVEPVVMQPLKRRWNEVRQTIENLLTTGTKDVAQPPSAGSSQSGATVPHAPRGAQLKKARGEAERLLVRFHEDLTMIKVLDPACGSGNFLYVTLQMLKDLEKEVITYAGDRGFRSIIPMVGPWQLYGIEINAYAHDLAQMVVWIGYLQWVRANGFGIRTEPILKPMESNFQCKDAILDFAPPSRREGARGRETPVAPSPQPSPNGRGKGEGEPSPNGRGKDEGEPSPRGRGKGEGKEPDWPKVDFIVGNPPFLGSKLMRDRLGDEYMDNLFAVWQDRVPHEGDLCCYWFEKARAHLKLGWCKRAGLLATQGIRGGANREVLKRIKETGDIFFAISDREWVLDGANVHVSMVGFDGGKEEGKILDRNAVTDINANLTATADVTKAARLLENTGISFMGDTKVGPFDISEGAALEILNSPAPHGRPHSDVVVPWVNGLDITRRRRDAWIIDFPPGTNEDEAALYEVAFGHISEYVRPFRAKARSGDRTGVAWWIHQRPRPDMRSALRPLPRFLGTPRVTKYRLFVWLGQPTLADAQLILFARSDDYFFGVLHSRVHEVWARAQGTQLRERESGFRYTPTTCFETFPLPYPPGKEPFPLGIQQSPLPSGEGKGEGGGPCALTPTLSQGERDEKAQGQRESHKPPLPADILRRVREMRRLPTNAEARLWCFLRNRQLGGLKFRRQHPVGRFIVDFYCDEKAMAVEVDGGQHDAEGAAERDAHRERELNAAAIRVIRLRNDDVLANTEGALQYIWNEAHSGGAALTPTLTPTLSQREREQKAQGERELQAAIAEAAKELDELRNNWLNPPQWTTTEYLEFPASVDGPWARYILPSPNPSPNGRGKGEGESSPNGRGKGEGESSPNGRGKGEGIGTVRYPRTVPADEVFAKKLKKRTLTNLYNERPTWLENAHRKLDEAVLAAYAHTTGDPTWTPNISDEEILEKLLALNLERAMQK